MSLIERAVARLNEEQGAADVSSPPAGSGASGAERRTSIEAFADRLDAGADDEVALAAAPRARGAASERSPHPVAPSVDREPVRIHLEGLRARGMVVPNGPATQSSHEFRVIKRPLLGNAFGRHGQAPVRNGKRIMVTSAFP